MKPRAIWADFVFALVVTGLGTAVRMGLSPLLGSQFPFSPLALAVVAAAAWAGQRAALFSMMLGTVSLVWFFLPRGAWFGPGAAGNWGAAAIYVAVCTIAIALFRANRRARAELMDQTRAREAAELEQRRVIHELHEATEKLRFHLENTPLGIVEWNPGGAVLGWNRGAERMFGWTAQEVLGREVAGLNWIYEEDLPAVKRIMEELATGRIARNVVKNRNRAKDGRIVECEWYNSVLADSSGNVRSVLSVAVDVTERNQTERALRESEAKLRAFFEAASQGIVAVDRAGRIVAANRRAEEMFGYERAELIGATLGALLPGAVRDAHSSSVESYFESPVTRTMAAGRQATARRKDGAEFPVEISLSLVDDQGSPLTLALITDITDRKRIEDQLRETQKLESLGLLAGGVAHDFNNLLTGMMGNASLALDQLSPDDPARGSLESVIRAADSAAHLTRQLLAYAGKGQFTMGPVDLSDAAEQIAGLVRRSISKNVRVELDLGHALPRIMGDPGQMNQVLMNLIINAAEAIPDGSPGVVRVTTRSVELGGGEAPPGLRGEPLAGGRYLSVEVRDNGSGMDEATLARIFDPFFTTKFLGRGLGLAAVHGILRAHRGGICVRSTPGLGSVFTVLLPASDVRPEFVREAARSQPAHGGTVLVLDDEDLVRSTAKQMLERGGWRVLPASNGREGILIVRQHPELSAVVLDWTMPGMNGAEVAARIRNIRPELAIVVITGFSESEAERAFAGSGVSRFVQKPFTGARLLEALNAAAHGPDLPG